jgi:hypothetical protein
MLSWAYSEEDEASWAQLRTQPHEWQTGLVLDYFMHHKQFPGGASWQKSKHH